MFKDTNFNIYIRGEDPIFMNDKGYFRSTEYKKR